MATTAEAYGFGARAPYAQPRASEYDMKERVRLSGLFPRVRNEPMSTRLQALLKDFEQNAALTGILERRRRLEERTQFELKGKEGIEAMSRTLAPPFRKGMAEAAVSASVAQRIARAAEEEQKEQNPDAEAVMTGTANLTRTMRRQAAAKAKAAAAAAAKAGASAVSQEGGSTSSTDPVLPKQFTVAPVAKAPPAKAAAGKAPAGKAPPAKAAPGKAPSTRRENRSPSTSRQRAG